MPAAELPKLVTASTEDCIAPQMVACSPAQVASIFDQAGSRAEADAVPDFEG